ncbi:hypothetical protein PSK37_27655 [Escherichia coli]|nr:hypothetical protein [Escherichia coli]
MKIKQHKEKLEIIRDIIRETLLGNAALIVLAAMVPVVLVKPWDSMTFIFMGAVCVSFAVILFWLVYIVCLYIEKRDFADLSAEGIYHDYYH